MNTPNFSEFMKEQSKSSSQDIVPQEAQLPQQQSQSNPFELSRYNNASRFPDTPIQFGGGLTESLLNDNEVPEEIRVKNWWIFHKDNTLTFLDEERKKSKLLNFDIAKIDLLNTTPYYDYTFEKELELGILRNVFETKLDRALGFKGTAQKNERIVLQSQFQETRQINDGDSGSNIKEGFFKRLLARR